MIAAILTEQKKKSNAYRHKKCTLDSGKQREQTLQDQQDSVIRQNEERLEAEEYVLCEGLQPKTQETSAFRKLR